MGTQKLDFFFQKSSKFEFWLLTKNWNHLSFVNISPTIVIDTSMERSSRVLHHGNPEMWNFFKKFEIDEIEFCPYPEFPYAEKKNRPGFVNFQSYITNWYVNGKVFTSTTTWEPKKKKIFFSKKFEIEFDLYFDLCWRAEIIQVGLNMHLYVDIGDASSSLWGSTSSFTCFFYYAKISVKKSVDCRILWQPITRKIHVVFAQKNVIEEKLLEIKRSIRRGIYLFQIRTGHFSR